MQTVESTDINQLLEHLFRHEAGKMIAVLTRLLGSERLELAEDVVQDAMIEAVKVWTYKGIPEQPTAWLYQVAKNKALNAIKRKTHLKKYVKETAASANDIIESKEETLDLFSEEEIIDDQLRMIFICCHPAINSDSQIALSLKTLCGFNIAEIARAFLTNKETINKRLVRARKKIRTAQIPFEVPKGDELEQRLKTVLSCIYLLFNEGYNASSGDELIRYDICKESIHLAELMLMHPLFSERSEILALLALMQLNASRFPARQAKNGNILILQEQDRSLWDLELMEQGFNNLRKSTQAKEVSSYHLLASISSFHCAAKNYESTNWNAILELYDRLLLLDNSPIVALNRTVALAQATNTERALADLRKIESAAELQSYYLFYSIKANFLMEVNLKEEAKANFLKAIELAPLESEKSLLKMKLKKIT